MIRSTASVGPSPMRLPKETVAVGIARHVGRGRELALELVAGRSSKARVRSQIVNGCAALAERDYSPVSGRLPDEVGVAAHGEELAVALRRLEHLRRGQRPAGLDLLEDLGRVVDAEHDQVAGPASVQRSPGGLQLVGHDLDVSGPGPGAPGFPHALQDEGSGRAALASSRVAVLADDDVVEVPGGNRPISRMSSSRRSPAVATTASAEVGRPRPRGRPSSAVIRSTNSPRLFKPCGLCA